MKLKTRLLISAALSLATAILVGIALFITFKYAKEEEKNIIKANDIQVTLFVLNMVAFDHLSGQQEKSAVQFSFIYEHLTGLLGNTKYYDKNNRVVFDRILENHRKIQPLFFKLKKNKITLSSEDKNKVMKELLFLSRSMVYDASLLTESSHENFDKYLKNAAIVTIVAIVIIISLIPIILFIINKHVVRPLMRLNKGMEIIGSGDLSYNVTAVGFDEIAQLTNAFNAMTSRLKSTTVSRDELAQEVELRGKVEAEYIRLNEELEKFAEERAKKLIESDEKFSHLMDSSSIGLMITNIEGNINDVNRVFLDLMGYETKEEIFALSIKQIYGSLDDWNKFIEEIRLHGLVRDMEIPLLRKNGTCVWVCITSKTYPLSDGTVQIFNAIQDISERRWAAEALKSSESKYRNLVETSHDLIWQLDRGGRFIFLNRAWKITHGYEIREMLGKKFVDFQKKGEVDFFSQISSMPKSKEAVQYETIHISKSDAEVNLVINAMAIVDSSGNVAGYQGTGYDISERKKMEKQIRTSLREKEVLLREIHHRVKNNMQVISSLIRLQSRYLKDDIAIGILNDTHNRVKSMALVHEKLHQSQDLTKVNFEDYMRDLTGNLLASYKVNEEKVSLVLNIAKIFFGIDTSVPLGLIASELISNALTHAFPGDRSGKIEIFLEEFSLSGSDYQKEYELRVEDNGIGFAEDIDLRNLESLGLQLVFSLSEEQLQGKVSVEKRDGVKYRIRFKEMNVRKRV